MNYLTSLPSAAYSYTTGLLSSVSSNLGITKINKKEIYAQIQQLICLVKSTKGSGTGFFIGQNRLIVSMHLVSFKKVEQSHLTHNNSSYVADTIEIVYNNQNYEARYLHPTQLNTGRYYDCCLLEIIDSDCPFFPEMEVSSTNVSPGEEIYFAGFLLGQEKPVFHTGTVSSISIDKVDQPNSFTIDGTIVAGNSGGPVFVLENNRLKLVGIISSQIVDLDPQINEDHLILRRIKRSNWTPVNQEEEFEITIPEIETLSLEPPFEVSALNLSPEVIYKNLIELYFRNVSTGIGKANSTQKLLSDITHDKSIEVVANRNRDNYHLVVRPPPKNRYDWNFIIPKESFGEVYHIAAAMLFNNNIRLLEGSGTITQQKFIKELFPDRFIKSINNPRSVMYCTEAIQKEFGKNPDAANLVYKKVAEVFILSNIGDDCTTTFYFDKKSGTHEFYANNEKKADSYLKNNFQLEKTEAKKVIVFVRRATDKTQDANMHSELLHNLIKKITNLNFTAIIVGDALEDGEDEQLIKKFPQQVIMMNNFFDQEAFKNYFPSSVAGQIYLYRHLYDSYNVQFIIGMKSGAMDGPAFTGIPTISLERSKAKDRNTDERMREASKLIPYITMMPASCIERDICECQESRTDNKCLLDIVMSSLADLEKNENFVDNLWDIKRLIPLYQHASPPASSSSGSLS